MSKISKIKVNGELYSISDLATQDALNSEVERAYAAEESIRAEFDGIRAKSDDNQLRLNELTKTEGDGSIQQQIEDTIANQVKVNPEVFDKLEEITQWIENNETGSADLVVSVQRNTEDIAELKGQSVFLTEEEYEYLVDNNLVQMGVEYNIYED